MTSETSSSTSERVARDDEEDDGDPSPSTSSGDGHGVAVLAREDGARAIVFASRDANGPRSGTRARSIRISRREHDRSRAVLARQHRDTVPVAARGGWGRIALSLIHI